MNISYILASIGVFLAVILVLVIVLLVAKKYLSPSGKVTITVNGSNVIEVEQGDTVMNSLNDNGIHLPSACGGRQAADSANSRCCVEAARFSIPRNRISRARRLKTTGVWAAR